MGIMMVAHRRVNESIASGETKEHRFAGMAEYNTIIKKPVELSEQERNDMVKLYLAHYDGSDEARFRSDLMEKTEVLLVNFGDSLIGFSTLQIYEREWAGKRVHVVYSGDTVVDRAHWGQQALSTRWITRMGELKREKPDLNLYWFLIVKGHRTFKYLPAFGKSFYPHWAIDRSDLKPLVDALAKEKFDKDYDPDTGIVAFDESRGHLKEDIAVPSEEEKSKDAVRFFMERNPNYIKGHELVCLCELEEDNMRPLTKRIFMRARQ